jgi:hypothetical protein
MIEATIPDRSSIRQRSEDPQLLHITALFRCPIIIDFRGRTYPSHVSVSADPSAFTSNYRRLNIGSEVPSERAARLASPDRDEGQAAPDPAGWGGESSGKRLEKPAAQTLSVCLRLTIPRIVGLGWPRGGSAS